MVGIDEIERRGLRHKDHPLGARGIFTSPQDETRSAAVIVSKAHFSSDLNDYNQHAIPHYETGIYIIKSPGLARTECVLNPTRSWKNTEPSKVAEVVSGEQLNEVSCRRLWN